MVGYDVGVLGEFFVAGCALAILGYDFLVQQLSHFRIRTDLPVSSRVLGIIYSTHSHLTLVLFSPDRFPATAEERTVKRAELISAEPHDFLQI